MLNDNNEGAKPALLCGAEQSSSPRNGGGSGGNVVAVTMQKRLALLLLTALLLLSLLLPGRNKRRRRIGLTSEEAEEPFRFRRRSDRSSKLLGAPDVCLQKKCYLTTSDSLRRR